MMEQYISEGMAAVLVGVHEDDIDKAAKSDTLLLQWLELKSSSVLGEVAMLDSSQTAFRRKDC